MIKIFPLRVVLTMTTGRLLTKGRGDRDNGIGDLYEIVNYILNDTFFTHQLREASAMCTPPTLEQFPELEVANSKLELLDKLMVESGTVTEGIDTWLELCITSWGMKENYAIGRIE